MAGVLMWEVFTCGEMPYRDKRNVDVVDYVITQNKRLDKPHICPPLVYKVMMMCWLKVGGTEVVVCRCPFEVVVLTFHFICWMFPF